MLKNKDEFKDRKDVYELLLKFEEAHKSEDVLAPLALAIILNKLKEKNITIEIDK